MIVTRRGFLHASAVALGGMAMAATTSTEASAKIAPNLVGYQPTPKDGHTCANCKLFEQPDACKSVEGRVSPTGWCKIWIKA